MIDFETFCKNCLDYIGEDRKCMRVWSPRTYDECSKECPEWLALSKPTLADVCGKRKLDSMTEEEVVEYRASFMENHRQDDTKKEVIEHIKLHIDWDEVPLLEVKWFLEKGFNVFGEGK